MSFDLEKELRQALRREEASPDFTNRVMARIAALPAGIKQEKSREKTGWWEKLAEFFRPAPMKWAMAGAIVCLLMFAVLGLHRYREHQRAIAEMAEGERAKEQVMLAMKIASAKLNVAQKKVQQSGERETETKRAERQ
ncbi:MAG: hypothetical protein L0226_08330 [Acidobacteria bacterium]|nr:hypothetical protein [Acidobacteriota bacterium]